MRFLLAPCALVAVTLSCSALTEPPEAARRFAELRDAPAWGVSPVRDSAFAAEIRPHREYAGFFNGGWHVSRAADRWQSLWDTVVVNYLNKPAAPAVNFAEEMVVFAAHGATATGGYSIEIVHVTRQRDTTFVLVRRVRPGWDCATTQAGTSPIAARVVPMAPPPTWFLVEDNVYECGTGRLRPLW